MAGISSRRNHCASTISAGSISISPDFQVGGEPDHQAVRERPRLAAPVAHVADFDADLLADLTHDRTLQRLAGLHESGEAAVHRRAAKLAHREPAAPCSPRVTSVIIAGASRGNASRPHAGQLIARSPCLLLRAACRIGRRIGGCAPTRPVAPRARRPATRPRRPARRRSRDRAPRRRPGRAPSGTSTPQQASSSSMPRKWAGHSSIVRRVGDPHRRADHMEVAMRARRWPGPTCDGVNAAIAITVGAARTIIECATRR